jgi:rod shape-determining protein MreD
MARHPRSRIGLTPSDFRLAAIPVATTMAGSMAVLLPIVATAPLLPPFGLLMLLAWRTLHRNIWPAWIALPLGFWDDLLSGAHLGTAMLLWTLTMLGLDALDRRLVWRDAWQEWAIAGSISAATILLSWLLAGSPGAGHGLLLLVPQIGLTALAFPLVLRLCDRLDHWRLLR